MTNETEPEMPVEIWVSENNNVYSRPVTQFNFRNEIHT